MTLGFTRNSLPLSKLIRWAFNEPVSHFVLIFDNKVVMHSNLKGVHIEWLETFKRHSEIVFKIDLNLPLQLEEEVYQKALEHDERPYDWGAFLWMCYVGFMFKFFKKELPSKNPWGSSKGDECIELAECVSSVVHLPKNLDAITPYDLFCFLNTSAD